MASRKLQGCIQNLLYGNRRSTGMNRQNFMKKPSFDCICLNNKCLVTCRFHSSFILYIFAYIYVENMECMIKAIIISIVRAI